MYHQRAGKKIEGIACYKPVLNNWELLYAESPRNRIGEENARQSEGRANIFSWII